MSDRRTTSEIRKARVYRPPLLEPPVVATEKEDTDPNGHLMSRTRTPADESLQDLLGSIRSRRSEEVPSEIMLALEFIAHRGAEDRRELEDRINAHLAATDRVETRWSRVSRIVKGIGIGAIATSLALVAKALISHGDAVAVSRHQLLLVERHGVEIVRLRSEQELLRAQAAADHALISIFAARWGAASPQ